MDNTGMFFDVPTNDPEIERVERELYEYLTNATPMGARFRGRIHPYVTKADPGLLAALKEAAQQLEYPCIEGITVSNSGFFASQGRDVLPIRPTIPEIDRLFAEFDPKLGGLRLENCEMESSALFLIAGGQGFPTATICPAVANRRLETFLHDSESAVKRSTEIAIRALEINRKRLSEPKCRE
jgi:uridine phosphorylase